MTWPGEKGVAPRFRGFCGVGDSLFTVSSGESCAVSFDDLTSRSWLLMNSWVFDW